MAEGSVEFVSGCLGSGKTLLAVEWIYAHLRAGGTACSNIEVLPDKIGERLAEEGLRFDPSRLCVFSDDQAAAFHEFVKRGTDKLPVLCVIDEDHLFHNSRDWNKRDDKLLALITLVRKLKIHLVFVTQDVTNIDKQFRKMAVREWQCRNLSHVKLLGVVRMPRIFVRVCIIKASGKAIRQHVDTVFSSPAFGLYNTNALLGGAAKGFLALSQAADSELERIPIKAPEDASEWGYSVFAAGVAAFFVMWF